LFSIFGWWSFGRMISATVSWVIVVNCALDTLAMSKGVTSKSDIDSLSTIDYHCIVLAMREQLLSWFRTVTSERTTSSEAILPRKLHHCVRILSQIGSPAFPILWRIICLIWIINGRLIVLNPWQSACQMKTHTNSKI